MIVKVINPVTETFIIWGGGKEAVEDDALCLAEWRIRTWPVFVASRFIEGNSFSCRIPRLYDDFELRKFETMWKEAVVAYFKIPYQHFPGGNVKPPWNSTVSVTGIRTKIPTQESANTNQESWLLHCDVRIDMSNFGRSRDSSVVQHWAAGWNIGGLSPGRGWKFFSSPPRPDRLCGPPSLLSNGY
jgi:hypothetical protein